MKSPYEVFMRLVRRLGVYRSQLVCALIGTFIQVAMTIYLPILIGHAIDMVAVSNKIDFHQLTNIIMAILIVTVINALTQWLTPRLYNQMTYQTIQQLRQEVFETIHRVPMSFLDSRSSGDLVSRLTTDLDQLMEGILMVFNQFLVGVLTILATIITMAQLDIWMMLIVVMLTPLSLFVARFIAQRSYHLFKQQAFARGEQTQIIEESVRQQTLIQLFNAQQSQDIQFQSVNETYAQHSRQAVFVSSTINPVTRFINALIYAVLAGVGAIRIIHGQFTVGALTTFLNYATQYTKPFNDISSVLAELQSALACANRVFEVLDMPLLDDSHAVSLDENKLEGNVEFRNVSFSYQPHQPLIENLSFKVPAGSKVAIVGPTGAGKSTLINLLMRFYDVQKGQILIDGMAIDTLKRASLRHQFGMVLQETWLESGTIHENIAFGYPEASRKEVQQAAQSAYVDHFVRQLPHGYDTLLSETENALSQGQRQLLSIARIFVKIPKILILDEATSSIDTRTEQLIQRAFEKLMEGRTSFIIAHRLSTVQSADLIIVMNQGAIVEQGTHSELMLRKGFYYQLQISNHPKSEVA